MEPAHRDESLTNAVALPEKTRHGIAVFWTIPGRFSGSVRKRILPRFTVSATRSNVERPAQNKEDLPMPLVAHLFGSLALSGSVGKSGTNKPVDIKIVKALLNTYGRSNAQPELPMDSADVDALATHIESFQKQKLNAPKPDGRVDPGGKTLTGLIQHLRSRYTIKSALSPTEGGLTWGTEGNEGGPYHSRRLHVPDGNSGLTLGRGYDLRERVGATAQADLASAGLAGGMAFKISTAAGKRGADASRFVIDNDLLDFEITPQVQLKLFEKVYDEHLADVKRISNGAAMVGAYGKVNWDRLDLRILRCPY